MDKGTKFVVFHAKETIAGSIVKDLWTFSMMALCIYISQGNAWWTFVSGIFFILFITGKIARLFGESNRFVTADALYEWAKENETN